MPQQYQPYPLRIECACRHCGRALVVAEPPTYTEFGVPVFRWTHSRGVRQCPSTTAAEPHDGYAAERAANAALNDYNRRFEAALPAEDVAS